MRGYGFHRGKHVGILVIVAFLGIILMLVMFQSKPTPPDSTSSAKQADTEAIRKEAYDLGYTNGYNTAKEENKAAYDKGYEAAQKEIGSGTFTRSGILGFVIGLLLSIGGFVAIRRKELASRLQKLRKQYELKKAFKTIPSDLSPEVDALAQQIARAYINVLEQLRTGKGYLISQYAQRWRPKLQELMKKAVRLMELIQELESARGNIDEQQLATTIKDLQNTVQNAKNEDAARNAAAKSLQRAKQTQQNLLNTQKNLEHCKTSLQGITSVLESMHLKISNLNVNTQKTELLDELSSDLETEMSALEEALSEVTS